MRLLSSLAWPGCAALFVLSAACSSEPTADEPAVVGAGQAGSPAGSGGKAGSAGQAGSAQGGAGSGQAGKGGAAGQPSGGAGQAGSSAGQGGAAGVSAGQAGAPAAGSAGAGAGEGGASGSPQAGGGGLGGGGEGGEAGQGGSAGASGSGAGAAGSASAAGAGGEAGQGGAGSGGQAGSSGQAGSGGQAGGAGGCEATGPEVCNGLDDDCDGAIDNNLSDSNAPCDTGKLGVCAAGVTSCKNGALDCAATNLPTSEECNGLDDDCNGSVDDALADLKCGVGECAATTPACVNGATQTCFPKDPVAEVCDGKDNNCDGVVDDGNVCCPVAQRCGALCCAGGDVCSFQQCVTPGKACTASEDCAGGEFCDYSLGGETNPPPGCQGSKQKTGKCMPRPPSCAGGQEPGDPPACVQKCEYKPPASSFDVALRYTWGGSTASPFPHDVLVSPVVVQLDDDDCDGKITGRDIPELVFISYTNSKAHLGRLRAISILGGQIVQKWETAEEIEAQIMPAAGDLDGDGKPEIVVCSSSTLSSPMSTMAFRADGTLLWKTDGSVAPCDFPAIADPEQSGKPVVLVNSTLLDGATGALKKTLSPGGTNSGLTSFADIDGDGKLDVVGDRRVVAVDGTVIWDLTSGPDAIPSSWTAVADLDKDGKPEVIAAALSQGKVFVLQRDPNAPSGARVVRKGVGLGTQGGGVLTVADFNGDGFPDVGTAGCTRYTVLDGKKLMDPSVADADTTLWSIPTSENGAPSCVTGSSVFDFNGDGSAEVVYADQNQLYILEGATGKNLIKTECSTSATTYEYPVVADVDGDDRADIIVASNAGLPYGSCAGGGKTAGLRVYSSKNNDWVRTRRVWNQHTYHVTNINEDGSVPQVELPNWAQPGLDNFRQNKQPAGEFSAPDLVVSLAPTCSGPYALLATVRNLGEAPVGPGVKVGFYTASGQKLGEVSTTTALYPAGAEALSLSLAQAPVEDVFALADDNSPPHPWVECRSDNNKSATVKSTCQQ